VRRTDEAEARRQAFGVLAGLLDYYLRLQGQPIEEHGCDGCGMCREVQRILGAEMQRALKAEKIAAMTAPPRVRPVTE
jgi:hypothetical protein